MTRFTPRKPLTLAAACLLLAACQSAPPIRYYTLVPAKPGEAVPAADPAYRVIVEQVSVPAQVDMPYMVVREGRSQLVPVEAQRWAAPLADEVRAALIDRLGTVVAGPGAAAEGSLPLYRLRVALRRFDSVLGRQALVDAAWTVENIATPEQTVTCDSQVAASIADGFPALADGHQRAVADLASRISVGLDTLNAGKTDDVCVAANSR
ncbi:MAG: PqiC family protein [Nevskia sp.]|nr:PqiC family protein [Nevskia sp.]